ncbi:hypothetical protein pb186bvf_010065 [Paramecium bursaria]
MLEIQILCNSNASSCFRGVFISIYSFMIFMISIYCLIRLYKYLGRFSFESLPLTTCAIQSLLHFIDILLVVNDKLQIVVVFFCLQTFILIAYSFLHVYYKLILTAKQFRDRIKLFLFVIALLALIMIIVVLISVINVNEQNCHFYFDMGLYFEMIIITNSQIICLVYGNKIISLLKRQQSEIAHKTQQQIKFVQYVLSSTVFFLTIFILLELYKYHDSVCNIPDYGNFTLGQNIYLGLFSILEMTPCLLVPVVFYYLPNIPEDDQEDITINEKMEISQELGEEFTKYYKERNSIQL